MEATAGLRSHLSLWIDCEKITRRPRNLLQLPQRCRGEKTRILVSGHMQLKRRPDNHRLEGLKVSCSFQNQVPGSVLDSKSLPTSLDEATILKSKSEEIEQVLDGQCVYLVGMMGSGKTTVGKVLADALGYSFIDSDKLIEDAAEGTPVAEIFKRYGESFFRDSETDVLRKLCTMQRNIISTGGGIVTRPINWKYMHKGISLWLDVPLEALARRIVAAGTKTRPLLHQESGDIYLKTLTRLTNLMTERSESYENADVRISFENIAAKLGCDDVCNLTPTVIAIEALVQIDNFLRK
ncbi:shikimate kinase, chloroplastic-like [Impatiens glandulifera]|uniref:shikimate kinase, chloroplastic-like n=1 Tax=Impatiens glandulifera TaxID=253017 RepID=UPI001FB1A1C0|nr:shikimate kinase, chloroplastic-like [Impatiens glandulifera]